MRDQLVRAIRFYQRQLEEVREGGRCILFRKSWNLLKLIFYTILCLPLVPVVVFIRLLRPLVLIRFGLLISSRIGHYAANTEIYLCGRDAGLQPKHAFDIFFEQETVCNRQLKKMWERSRALRVWSFSRALYFANKLLPGSKKHTIPIQSDRDIHGLIDSTPGHLSFTPEEERKGREELNKLGIPDNAGYICFHGRNPYYLKKVFPSWDFSYHDYLDVDIRNFIPAVEELCRRGNFLVRTGAVVKEPLEIVHPMIIDYAWNHRSDFLDVYLAANCRFYLLSPTGIYAVAEIFRRPGAFVNVASVEYVVSWARNTLSIFKKYWLIKERRFMTFREILDSGAGRFVYRRQFEQLGIELIENTPEEITALAIEMDERLNGTWQTTEEDEELQQRFWSLYKASELHGKIVSRIGTQFLRQHRHLLE